MFDFFLSCLTNVRDKSVLSLCLVSICRQHGGGIVCFCKNVYFQVMTKKRECEL